MNEQELEALRLENPQDPRLPENQNQSTETPSGLTEDRTLQLLRDTVVETNRRAREEEQRRIELEEELRNLRNQNNAPKPNNFTSEDYFANPVEVLRAEISQQIAPLLEFSQGIKKQNAYQALKNQFLADSRYGSIVTQLGHHLDNLMLQIEPTQVNMINAIQSLVGRIAIENPNFFATKAETVTTPEASTTPTPPMVPAHLRPSSAPTRSSGTEKKVVKNYTENERRLMREYKMNEEQWEAYMNAPSSLSGVK